MTQIKAIGRGRARVRAALVDVFALLLDVERVGRWWPGVEKIESLGDGRYRWTNEPRRAVGKTFHTEYVAQYRDNGRDEITFHSVAGNTDTAGFWRLRSDRETTVVSVEISSAVDIPIPRLVKKPAEIFANREVTAGIEAQLAQIKKVLERA